MNPVLKDMIETAVSVIGTLLLVGGFLYRRLDGMVTAKVKAQVALVVETITRANSEQLRETAAELREAIREQGQERREDIGRLTDRLDQLLISQMNGNGRPR